jgi:preprotein translocase subunit SecA
VANFQRRFIYDLRNSLLENEKNFAEFLNKSVREVLVDILKLKDPALIAKEMLDVFRVEAKPEEIQNSLGLPEAGQKNLWVNEWLNPFYSTPENPELLSRAQEQLVEYLTGLAEKIKNEPEVYAAGQNLILQIIDTQWSGHLELMDVLKEEANLFSYASEDPLIDYILESRKLFADMISQVKRQFLAAIFLHLQQKGLIE